MGAMALTMLIALQIIAMRIAARRRSARQHAMVQAWRPLLNAAVMGETAAQLPPLAARDMMRFMVYWLQMQQSVRGEAGRELNTLARRVGCDALARRLLVQGNRAERVVATLVLGHLRETPAWPDLERAAAQPDSAASILALWALAQIDPGATAAALALPLLQRADWPLGQLANILQSDRTAWEPALADAMESVDQSRLAGALRLVAAVRMILPPPVLERMLGHSDTEVVIAALRLAVTPESTFLVRAHLSHADWRVRAQAARALGPLGGREDIAPLRAMLADREWWVRYRAAQALASLPFLRRDELTELASGDRFASDIMRHVLAEQGAT
ncbi:HEAT repeat domain-containing protein [Massilia sp. METH4]|uniref:HEAT repeat domain-containing protein n=1 Tax=Massilia sp. METH4 TaxID=3123041 RepID=UPI0030CE3152